MKKITLLACSIASIALIALFSGCRSAPSSDPLASYYRALNATAPENMALIAAGTDAEKAAIQQFIDVFSQFDADNLTGGISGLYAEEVYFQDTLVELHTGAEVEAYFLGTLDAVAECTFDIVDVAVSDGNYYFRWEMTLLLERYKDEPADVSIGMTHIRFNEDGRIVFHQDYWDSANLYKKLPVIGGMIRWINSRLES
jgi:limonene-1,2-epoxide hydrolase